MLDCLWFCLGCLMVALGIIGAVLPVMPTTVFLIAAVGCFTRSSPRLAKVLLQHPRYGPSLRLWREQGAVSSKGKALAAAGMALGYALFWWKAHPMLPLALTVAALLAASAAWVVSRPAPRTCQPRPEQHLD